MPLSASDVSTLSRLLDEAMDLPSADIEPWLLALSEEHAALLPPLRRMLCERTGRKSFLASGPSLGERDGSVAREGDQVGAYRLLREIGKGGMGTVWLAERADGSLKRKVALKLPRLAWGAGLAERMARERDIGALLEHPHIARLYDAGVDAKGRPYLALEHIDGVPLDQWCRENALSIPERLGLFVPIARAVAYAHGRLVVHRDLKPSNVLVTADGQAHLLDFGIAKLLDESAQDDNLTQEEGRVLTPHYASPEQIEGGQITVASDVYSLGVLLYELLTRKRPYDTKRDSLGAMADAIVAGQPALASSRGNDRATTKALRGELDAILTKALKREPGERYATADAFADDVERHLQGDRVLAQPDSLGYRMKKAVRRHWLGVMASASVLLAIVVGFASTLALYLQVLEARSATEAQAAIARSVNDYLVRDLLAAANPMSPDPPATGASAAAAGQVPVRALLDRAARRAGERFAGQPALEAAVRMSLGEAYDGNAAYRESAQQYLLAHEQFAAARPRQPLPEANALFRAGAALREADDYEAAGKQLGRALAEVSVLGKQAGAEGERLRVEVRQAQAWLLYKQGQYTEAIETMQSELPALERAFGAASDEVATVLVHLANTQMAHGRMRDAVVTARKGLEVRSKVSNPQHAKLIEAHSTLSDALRFSGQQVEALSEARTAYEMSGQLLGPDHLITLIAEGSLASVLQEMKRFDEAIALFEDAVARCASRYGEVYYDTTVLANNLGLAYADAARTAQAISMLERSLAGGTRLLGPDHPENLTKEHNLADVLADDGRWGEALELEQRVLPRAQKAWGPVSASLGAVHRTLGRLQMHFGRWAEARASLLEARRQLIAELGSEHRRVLQVDQMLKELAEKGSRSVALPTRQ